MWINYHVSYRLFIDAQLHGQVKLIFFCVLSACRDTNRTVVKRGECLMGNHDEGVGFCEGLFVLTNRYREMSLVRCVESCVEFYLCYCYYQRCAKIVFLILHFWLNYWKFNILNNFLNFTSTLLSGHFKRWI